MLQINLPLNTKLLLGILVLLGVFFRYDFNPDAYFFDDRIPVDVISFMEENHTLDTNWGNVANSWHIAQYSNQYNFSSYITILFHSKQLINTLGFDVNPLVLYRFMSMLFQMLAAVVIFAIAIRWFGQVAAISSLAFFVVVPVFSMYAHYARPESLLVLSFSIMIWCHFSFMEKASHKTIGLAALCSAIIATCKISLIPLVALSFCFFIFTSKNRIKDALLYILIFIASCFLFAPYIFIHVGKYIDSVLYLVVQYFGDHPDDGVSLAAIDWLLPEYLFIYLGPLSCLLMLLAVFSQKLNEKCFVYCGLFLSVVYVLFFSLASFFNESNIVHFAPVWALIFGLGFACLVNYLSRFAGNIQAVYPVVLLVVLALPFYISVTANQYIYRDVNGVIPSQIKAYSQQLLVEENAVSIISGDEIHSRYTEVISGAISTDVIIQVPWYDQNEYVAIHQQLQSIGYRLLGEFVMPLGNFPTANIQMSHFPAAYRFYKLDARPN